MPILRGLAYFISVIFHPLLILTYMLVLLLLINPYLFGVNTIIDSTKLVLLIFLSTFFIPMVSIVMMRAVGFLESLSMPDRKERTIPYIVTGIFYMWMYRNLLDNPEIPIAFKIFVLGATIGLFMAFVFNLFTKISMHAVGMGGLLGMTVITMMLFSYNSFFMDTVFFGTLQVSTTAILMLVMILTGLVCTARLVLNAHTMQDIYAGFIVGMSTQFIALQIML